MDPTDGHRDDDEEAPLALEVARRERRRRARGGGVADVIGGAIVGFDYQVFRATKQPAILVESAKLVRGLSGEGGALLSIGFPDDPAETDPSPAGDPPAASEPGLR
jgi:hypothetical protein